jgi:hypothetical protein
MPFDHWSSIMLNPKTLAFAIITVEALLANIANLVTATVTDVCNYTNTNGNPAKCIDAKLGRLQIQFIKNPTEGLLSVDISGKTAWSSYNNRLFRDTITMDTKLVDIALDKLRSGDMESIQHGHAIAQALLGYDPCGF